MRWSLNFLVIFLNVELANSGAVVDKHAIAIFLQWNLLENPKGKCQKSDIRAPIERQ